MRDELYIKKGKAQTEKREKATKQTLAYECSPAFLTRLVLFCMSFSLSYSVCFTKLSSIWKRNLVIFFHLDTNTIRRNNYARGAVGGIVFRGCLKSQTALLCLRFKMKENYLKLAKLISKNSDTNPVFKTMQF